MYFDEFSGVRYPAGSLGVTLLALMGSWVAYQFCMMLYNLSPLHPLSHIPGPKLSRGTYFPEIYHDLVKHGRYTERIKRMHEKYGPIVRISPNEVHCNDIDFCDEIYAGGNRKRDKPHHFTNASAHNQSSFSTPDNDLHKLRRGPVAKFFARGMITRFEEDIHRLSQTLCDKLLRSVDGPIDVAVAYSCFTSDIISMYCFGESFGFLQQKDWFPNFHDAGIALLQPMYLLRYFPILTKLYDLGHYFIEYLPKNISLLIRTFRVDIPNRLRNTQAEIDSGVSRDSPTIFGTLLQLPPKQKEAMNPVGEALALLGGGTETTSWALAVTTYHLLNEPKLLKRLRRELEQAVDDPRHLPRWSELESLPYLQAVVQEGLRLSYGVSSRSPRVATEENLIYRGVWRKEKVEYMIPKGCSIGMSCIMIHHDENLFPDSYSFIPERWLDTQNRKSLDHNMFAFSRGSRMCVGMNLALCEFYVALAALTLRVLPRMHLFETTEEDVLCDYDLFIPRPKATSKGVRVIIE